MTPKPFSHSIEPKPERRSARERMTAILGLNYLDGVLMMADTEETLGGGAKSECDKLHRFIFSAPDLSTGGGTVLTGGSGDSHLVECANQELERFFSRGMEKGANILQALNGFAGDFFTDSMRGYQGFDLNSIPDFSMLIALNIRPTTWLFHWYRNRISLVPKFTHTSIGVGMAHLHPMLRDVQFSGVDEVMLFLGLRMMFYTKRTVEGVGGKTEAVALQNDGRTHWWGTDITAKIEELVSNLDQILIAHLYTSISHVTSNVKDVEKNVQKNFAGLPELMQLYRREYKKILKQSDSQKLEDQQ